MRAEDELNEVRRLVREQDAYAACERVQARGTPEEIAAAYSRLVRELYFKARDIPAVIGLGRGGIHYCLAKDQESARVDPDASARLRGLAKEIAYNLGSFTWPGWDEPGIAIGPPELGAGMEAARLNLRLAVELKRGAVPMANAHWLLGAHFVAVEKHSEGAREFREAAGYARREEDVAVALMSEAYAALAGRLAKPGERDAAQKLKTAREALLQEGVRDGKFYADQIDTAERVFRRRDP